MNEVYVYSSDAADFDCIGLVGALTPISCYHEEIASGLSSVTMEHPIDDFGRWKALMRGNILKCRVPVRTTPEINGSTIVTSVEIWRVKTTATKAQRYVYSKRENGNKLKLLKGGKKVTVVKKPSGSDRYKIKTGEVSGWMESAAIDYETVLLLDFDSDGIESAEPSWACRDQLFRIYEETRTEKAITVKARHITYDLLGNLTTYKNNGSVDLQTALDGILGNCEIAHDFSAQTNIADTRTGVDWTLINPISALLDPDDGVLSKWACEMVRDNWELTFLPRAGLNRGARVEYGKNLLGVTCVVSEDEVITRVIPTGEEDDGTLLYLADSGDRYIDSDRINFYNIPHVYHLKCDDCKVGTGGVTKAIARARMREQALELLDSGCDEAAVSMDVSFIDLGDTEEYAQYRGLEKTFLYDTVRVSVAKSGISAELDVVRVKTDCLTGRRLEVELGSLKDTVATIASYQIGSFSGGKIRAGTIGSGQLGGDSITARHIQAGSVVADKIAAGAITAGKIAAGSIQTDDLSAGAITAGKISAGAVTAETIDAGAVTAEKIAAGAVTADKIDAGAITAGKITAGSIQTDDLAAEVITAGKLAAGAVTAEKIDAGAITAGAISAGAVTADSIAAGTITAEKIASGAVTAGKVDAGAITAEKIAAGAVTAGAISAGAVTADSIAAGTITAEKLASGLITADSGLIADASIIDAMIVGLTADKITAGTIDAANINVVNLSADNLTVGTINGQRIPVLGSDKIADGAISGVKIGENAITTDKIVARAITTDKLAAAAVQAINIDVSNLFANDAFIGALNTADISNNSSLRIAVGDLQRSNYRVEVASSKSCFTADVAQITLTATAYKDDIDVTDEIDNDDFVWSRVSSDYAGDIEWNAVGKSVVLDASAVDRYATFTCTIQSDAVLNTIVLTDDDGVVLTDDIGVPLALIDN